MKRYIASLALLWSATAYPSTYVIALPGTWPGGADALFEPIARLVLLDMKPGDSLKVYDGQNLRALGDFAIPNKRAYAHAKVRKRRFLQGLRAVKAHVATLPSEGESLDVIRFLDHLASHVAGPRSAGQPAHVLLVGAPEHRDAREPSFAMGQGQGLFPSDGHITAGPGETPYGTADKRGRLAGFQVHWLHSTDPGAWENHLYRQRVSRFWHLWVQAQGGHLLTFTSDTAIAFERLQQHDLRSPSHALDHTAGKVEMLRARRNAAQAAPLRIPLSSGDAFLGDDVTIATVPPVRTRGHLKVGIRWPCARCDLDLYARAGSDAPFLYYGRSQTDQGRYNKDFQTSPDTSNGLEYIEFKNPVDLRQVQVLINYYGGGSAAGGPKGSLRAFFDGHIYEVPFHIRATQGNQGSERAEALTSAHWDTVDLPVVLGLPARLGEAGAGSR